MSEYLKSAFESVQPICALLLSAIMYMMFPETSYLTAFCAVVGVMILDVITKYYSISVLHGGLWKSIKEKYINSNSMWVGTSRKIFAYLVIFIMVGLSYRVSTIYGISAFLATVVYSVLFLRECQSILENLNDAGSDVKWLLAIVKKKKKKILMDVGVDEDETIKEAKEK
jgi:phage-related holin